MVAGEERRSEEQLRTNFQAVFDACASRLPQSRPPLLRMLRLVGGSALGLGGALGMGGALALGIGGARFLLRCCLELQVFRHARRARVPAAEPLADRRQPVAARADEDARDAARVEARRGEEGRRGAVVVRRAARAQWRCPSSNEGEGVVTCTLET